jgi:FtsZ-interacting cell division protein ZipA
MDITTTIIILIAIGVIIGFVAGLLVAGLRPNRNTSKDSSSHHTKTRTSSARPGQDTFHSETPSWLSSMEDQKSHSTGLDTPPSPEESVKPPSMNPVDILARAVQADVKSPEQRPKSIVSQVDEILQERLAGTTLGDRGVFLQETPSGGMVVQVGMDKYEGVESVPDEEIRQAIRDAVSVWENQIGDES